jgi:mRNA-degrading endonuclease RelE of RelBE toxin-antitoxin system
MDYQVVLARSFKHSLKKLKKRYNNVNNDIRAEVQELLKNPNTGVVIRGGGGVRKTRVRNTDSAKGKSGGYRLLYYVENKPIPTIYLLLLYAKSDQDDVTRNELEQLLAELRDT